MMQGSSEQERSDASAPNAKVEAAPAQRIAQRYEVVTKLAGGMAYVYLCRDLETERLVALKTFKPELLSHRTARDLFLREGTMWVELGHHPNIVRADRVERIGDGREVYLVLEWVVQPKGKATPALRSWLFPGRALSVEQAIRFSLDVTRGMDFAAKKIPGLVHRDLKPENILIGHDGRAKVTDFGLASTLSGMSSEQVNFGRSENDMGRTQITHGVVGTPLYMSPEQWRHMPVDERADIYGLGCILYEMLTGRFAAPGKTRDELRSIHLTGRIKPPPETVPRDLVLFLRRCLAADRSERFQNWAEVNLALQDVYRQVLGAEPPPERMGAEESQEERLAAGHSYNEMGLSYLDIGKLDVAVMYFEQSVSVGRAEGSLSLECQGLGNLGLAYMALGYLDRAIEFHEEHLTLAREIGDKAEEARALGNLGRAHRRLGDPNQAITFHEDELAIARLLEDRFREAGALDSLGDTYRRLEDKTTSETLFKESLAIARQIGDRARVRSIVNSMGRIYLASGDLNEAKALFKQSLDIARAMGDRVSEGEVFADLGDLHYASDDIAKATEFYERALAISQESDDRRREFRNLVRLGDMNLVQKELSEADRYYEAALEANRELRDISQEQQVINRLGRARFAAGNYMSAAGLYRRMLEIAQASGDHVTQQRALVNLGKAYEQWGDLRRTADYMRQHIVISQEIEDHPSELKMLVTLADLYRGLDDLQTARKVYEEYLALARKLKDPTATGDALNKLGDIARDYGRPLAGVEYYREALLLAEAEKDPLLEASSLGNLAVAYNDLGKKWQATRHGDRAVRTALQSKDANSVAWAKYRLALVLYSQKKHAKAHANALHARKLFSQLGESKLVERMELMLRRIKQQQS